MKSAEIIREKNPKKLHDLEKIILIYDLSKKLGVNLPENTSINNLIDLLDDIELLFIKYHNKMSK